MAGEDTNGSTSDGAVLTVNAGSSSLQLIYVEGDAVTARLHQHDEPGTPSAARAVREFVSGRPTPRAVGHRLVHGGTLVRRPTVLDAAIRRGLDEIAELAPLHLPPALRLLDQLVEQLPDVPHVLCPDTAFHADLPEVAATFPLPEAWRRRWGLRRYGFHGISYASASRRAAHLLGRPVEQLQLVLAHLGGGSSVCAVRAGRSVDTSMGFTPLDGVPMTKRSGAVDPGLLLWLLDGGRLTREELAHGLNHRSGLFGLSNGRSNDTRELVAAAPGDPAAALALDVFCHRVRREIAATATSLDRLDGLVFTGEIGWDQPEVRRDVCAGLGLLGVEVPWFGHPEHDQVISADGAAVPVLVVEPREELEIAQEVAAALAVPGPTGVMENTNVPEGITS